MLEKGRRRIVDGQRASLVRNCDREQGDGVDRSAYLSVEFGCGGRVVDLCLPVCDQ